MSTTVVHLRDSCDVYIGRPSIFGNPFQVAKYGREECLCLFREYFYKHIASDPGFKAAVLTLMGKRLGCYCAPLPCHGDVIKEYLDATEL